MTNDQDDGTVVGDDAAMDAIRRMHNMGIVARRKRERSEPEPDLSWLENDNSRLIPWQPQVKLISTGDSDGKEVWKVLVDSVDIGWTYDTYDEAGIALWAVQAAVDRLCKVTRSAAQAFYQEQANR